MSEWKESISLEETNKIRVSLGLKPLEATPAAAVKSADEIAEDNYTQRKAEESKAKAAQELKEKIDKARNERERQKVLKGKTLADGDDDGDTKAWLKKQKKRAKEQALAAKKARELQEQDEIAQYTEADLSGLKVAHGADAFEEGAETVLTLKDSRILDDEDDELHNVNLSENARYAKAVEIKKKGTRGYTGYDDAEFADPGAEKSVLAKYDDAAWLGDTADTGFKIGEATTSSKRPADSVEPARELKKTHVALDFSKTFSSDYMDASEDVSFKKHKKKHRKLKLKAPEAGDVVSEEIARENLDRANLIDDDDLQVSLARSRREKNRKRVKDLLRRGAGDDGAIKTEEDVEMAGVEDVKGEVKEEEDLLFNDTASFVQSIQVGGVKAERARTPAIKTEDTASEGIKSEGIKSEDDHAAHITEMDIKSTLDEGDAMGDVEMGDVSEEKPSTETNTPKIATSEETLFSQGMASTLNMLRNQGLIKPMTPEERERDRRMRERDAWIAKQRARDREREEAKQRTRDSGIRRDQKQREQDNRIRDKQDALMTLEAFKDYKPIVDIKYTDEFGRNQTPKEAWKQLSHDFHGKGSGTKKEAKRLQHIAEERKREAMQSGDTPLSSASAFKKRAEKTGEATMVLSTGNRN